MERLIAALAGWKAYALVAVAGALLFWGARLWLAHDRQEHYDAGYAAATTEQKLATAKVVEEYRQREQTQQRKADERYAEQQKALDAALADRDSVRVVNDGLRGTIAAERAKAAANAERAGRNVAKATAAWDVLESCRKEYAALADDLERVTAAFRKTQAWASVIDTDGAIRNGYLR